MGTRSKRRLIPWVLAVLALLSIALFKLRGGADDLRVEIVRVERGEVREMVVAASAGEVMPARRVIVRAEMAGTVSRVEKRPGDRVLAGETIVTFASGEIEARVRQARANLEAARVTVRVATTRRDATKRAVDRAKLLHDKGAVSSADFERATTEADAATQAVEQARATEKQAEAALELASVSSDRATVEAPFAGVLQDVHAELGVQLAPGAPLFDLIDASSVWIDVPVDEADIARVEVGQKVFLRVGNSKSGEIQGAVRFIPPAVGKEGTALEALPTKARDHSLHVRVEPSSSSRLLVGSSVSAEILVASRESVVFVPTSAVIGRGSERSVYRVEGKKLRRVPFHPGVTSWERTEVVSGLAEGDEVVSSLGVKGLDDGVTVSVESTGDGAKTRGANESANGKEAATHEGS